MATSIETAALDRIVEALSSGLSSEAARGIVDLSVDEKLQAKLDELADKSTEGQLTDTERAEYETYVRAIDFISILQLKARRILANSTH